jgi:predicted DCC family thiol-disulfide oxidoreductase YuxK
MHQSPVILFDGVCNLCCGWVQFLIRQDKKALFRFASIQSEAGEKLLTSARLDSAELKTIVYLRNKEVYIESAAILEIFNDLGGMWRIVKVFKLIPKVVRDRIYRFIAQRRYRVFGKRSACLIPSVENEKRFLL